MKRELEQLTDKEAIELSNMCFRKYIKISENPDKWEYQDFKLKNPCVHLFEDVKFGFEKIMVIDEYDYDKDEIKHLDHIDNLWTKDERSFLTLHDGLFRPEPIFNHINIEKDFTINIHSIYHYPLPFSGCKNQHKITKYLIEKNFNI